MTNSLGESGESQTWETNNNWLSKSHGSLPQAKQTDWGSFREEVAETTWPKSTFLAWRNAVNLDEEARFQQKQLEEKEQKLVRIYETQQAHALKRVGGTTTTNSLAQSTGKVRQMFEERRTKAGIDKSYPLQPLGLNNRTTKQSTGNGVVATTTKTTTRNGYHTKVDTYKSTSHQNSNGHIVRHETTMEVRQKSNSNDLPSLNKTYRLESDRILRDQNLNDEFLDDVTLPDGFELSSIETVTAKLPNVGGALPSQKQAAKLKENNNNNIVSKNENKKVFDNVKMNGDVRAKVAPIQSKVGNGVRSFKSSFPVTNVSSPAAKAMKPVTDNHINTLTNQTTAQIRSKVPPIEDDNEDVKAPVKKPSTPVSTMSSKSSPKSKSGSPNVSPARSGSAGSGVECKICKRRFADDRIEKHQTICAKTAVKKRKPYDPIKHRIEGTGAEKYVKVQRKGNKVLAIPKSGNVKVKPNNWRTKHEDFIRTIKAAKEAQAYVEKGGKLSDLPPPPPSENPDYVQCPHCKRRFNEQAAERHIPKCANFQFNKPAAKKR